MSTNSYQNFNQSSSGLYVPDKKVIAPDAKQIIYKASPTASRFHLSKAYFRGLRGPVGSGKSTSCMLELFLRAHLQEPWEGVRRTRWVLIRNTYPELKQTTIKTWQHWVPNAICPLVYDVPIRGKMVRKLPDGTIVEMEVIFMAVDSEEDVGKLLSTEYTGAYINEASEISRSVITTLPQRVGRYPATIEDEHGNIVFKGATWSGIVADTNPPSTRHWWYEYAENSTPDGFEFFVQPPAMLYDDKTDTYVDNPEAENIRFLPGGYEYYHKIVAAANGDHNTIRRMVCNEYGVPLNGKPVFPNFKTKIHVATKKLLPDKQRPLVIALDWGLTPACVFMQQGDLGGVRLLEEITPTDVSLEEFLDNYVLVALNDRYANMSWYVVGDPSGRGRSANDKRTPFDVLKERNLYGVPAITNSFIPRKEAVDYFLNRTNGFLMSPEIVMAREGFMGQYAYARLVGSKFDYKPLPEKNEHSHVMDSIQYGCLFIRYGGQKLNSRKVNRKLRSGNGQNGQKKVVKYA